MPEGRPGRGVLKRRGQLRACGRRPRDLCDALFASALPFGKPYDFGPGGVKPIIACLAALPPISRRGFGYGGSPGVPRQPPSWQHDSPRGGWPLPGDKPKFSSGARAFHRTARLAFKGAGRNPRPLVLVARSSPDGVGGPEGLNDLPRREIFVEPPPHVPAVRH